MLKKYAQFWLSIFRGFDITLALLSLAFAIYLRFGRNGPLVDMLSQYHFFKLGLTIALIWPAIGGALGLYRARRMSTMQDELRVVWKATSLSTIALVLVVFFLPLRNYPRLVLINYWWLSLTAITMGRVVLRYTLRSLRSHGLNTRRAVIVGAGKLGLETLRRIQTNPWMGLNVVGFVDDYKDRAADVELPILGRIRDIESLIQEYEVDRVFIALPVRAYSRVHYITETLADRLVETSLVPDIFQTITLNASASDLDGLPIINLTESTVHGWDAIFKRVLDIMVAACAVLITGPLMLFIAFLLKLESPKNPVLFSQWRYGIDGRRFRIYKFRSMVVMEDGNEFTQAKKGDARVTPLGYWLRRLSLDELPQFFNVLEGSMSVVGPRPHAVAHNEEYRRRIKNYMLRHKVKPGITGWAQINGWRGETDTFDKMENRVRFDTHYIENWSLWMDLKIIVMTIFRGFVHKNAY